MSYVRKVVSYPQLTESNASSSCLIYNLMCRIINITQCVMRISWSIQPFAWTELNYTILFHMFVWPPNLLCSLITRHLWPKDVWGVCVSMAKSAHNCHLSRFMPTVMMDCGDKLLVYLLSVVLCVCVCVVQKYKLIWMCLLGVCV